MRFLILSLLASCASAAPADLLPDAASPPPAPIECTEDQHACGPSCVDPLRNDPANGCARGCGAPCPVAEHAIATCNAAGTCDFTCATDFARIDGSCVATACEAYACGQVVDDAGHAFECGACVGSSACGTNHQCTIAPDAHEDNDIAGQATLLGDFNDVEDPVRWIDDLSIDSPSDEDWFRFHITDGFDAGNPRASVELASHLTELGWLGSAHELTVWFACDGPNLGSRVRCGAWFTPNDSVLSDAAFGTGCTAYGSDVVWAELTPSCLSIADSGIVTVRVRKRTPPRGDTYDMRIGVD